MRKTAYKMKKRSGDIRKEVFTKVFDLMKKGKTYANDGNHRDLKQDLDFSSWFTNYHLPYEHCELWGVDGKLTMKGVRLYQIAETYGWDSEQPRSGLARAYCEMARLLALMKYLWDIQMKITE